MSTDFQIAWSCKHNIVREPVSLAEDRRTVVTSIPIVADAVMHINGHKIPSGGLYSAAKLKGSKGGPFVFNETKTLEIVTAVSEYSFILPPGRWSAQEVLERLYFVNSNLIFSLDLGRLVIEDTEQGRASMLRVSGSAKSVLGFDIQSNAVGQMLYPPWGILVQEGYIYTQRPIFLQTPKNLNNAKIEMSYTVAPQTCRRCMATRVENDLMFTDSGEPVLISDENLLYQFVLKALLTDRGSNPFHRWYGTQLRELQGQKAIRAAASAIRAEVKRTVSTMQALQQRQMQFQKVSLKETLYQIDHLDVMSHENDPTTFLVDLTIRNASNKRIDLSIVFTVPGATAFVSNNGKVVRSLGTY